VERRKWEKALIVILTVFLVFDFITRYRDYMGLKEEEERAITTGDYDLAEEYHHMAHNRMKGFIITLLIYLGIVSPLAYDMRRKGQLALM
jgi:hypothetical protein